MGDPNIIGFKWGTHSFSADVYREYARPLEDGAESGIVDLRRLYNNMTNFTCTVYVGREKAGDPKVLQRSPLKSRLGFDDVEAERGAGKRICRQRWTLLRLLFYTDVGEMWFCYMPPQEWSTCEENAED